MLAELIRPKKVSEMTNADSLPFGAPLEQYQIQAEALIDALQSGEEAAPWRFKWMHPCFHGKTIAEVRAASLTCRRPGGSRP